MTKEEKIEYILEVTPNVSKIIRFVTEDQIESLYEQAQQKFQMNLIEACY